MGYNTVAEIPGTDLKDEIVMLGGHMDSWHAGTGATDNGAGFPCMEAVRIIQRLSEAVRAIRSAMDREEQGLLAPELMWQNTSGSLSLPRDHGTCVWTTGSRFQIGYHSEYEKFAGYFQSRQRHWKIRGVYLQGMNPCGRYFVMANAISRYGRNDALNCKHRRHRSLVF